MFKEELLREIIQSLMDQEFLRGWENALDECPYAYDKLPISEAERKLLDELDDWIEEYL